MKRTKEIVDKRIAASQEERGVFILLTGNGKGKSSSAFGMVARALGHGQKVAVVQFVKGRMETGEQNFFDQQENVDFHVMGDGFTWETQSREKDKTRYKIESKDLPLQIETLRTGLVSFFLMF